MLIVDGRHHIGVAGVVDPWHVLVADAFDAVAAEAELVESGTLQRFGGDNSKLRVSRAEVVASRNRARAAGGRDITAQSQPIAEAEKNLVDGFSRHMVVPNRIAEFFE